MTAVATKSRSNGSGWSVGSAALAMAALRIANRRAGVKHVVETIGWNGELTQAVLDGDFPDTRDGHDTG